MIEDKYCGTRPFWTFNIYVYSGILNDLEVIAGKDFFYTFPSFSIPNPTYSATFINAKGNDVNWILF